MSEVNNLFHRLAAAGKVTIEQRQSTDMDVILSKCKSMKQQVIKKNNYDQQRDGLLRLIAEILDIDSDEFKEFLHGS